MLKKNIIIEEIFKNKTNYRRRTIMDGRMK